MSNAPKSAAPWLDLAMTELGTKEVPGAADNPVVVAYFADVGHSGIKNDETAWCAAFLGSVLKRAGSYPLPPSETRLLARSYLSYGIGCIPKVGAIGIWPRGAAWQGHVGFVVSVDLAGGTCDLLAGNQGNTVSIQRYQLEEALDFRWPVKSTVQALRKAGSTEVKAADKLEVAGAIGAVGAVGTAAVIEVTRSVPETSLPVPESVIDPEGLTLIEQLTAAAKAVGAVVASNPWLGAAVVACLILFIVARRLKTRRVARAAAGVPLSMEVLGR